MSRSFHQRHKTFRNKKNPRTIIDMYIDKNGKRKIIWRKRRMQPYGLKRFIGYGEETYSKKFGEYFMPQVNKNKERSKENIITKENAIDSIFNNKRDKMIIETLCYGDKLYEVSANGYDYDVFEITVLRDISIDEGTFIGIEYGNPHPKERTYDVKFLYTREEVENCFKIILK